MSHFANLCNICAKDGVLAMLGALGGSEDLRELAQFCAERATQADEAGDATAADHLENASRSLIQYLIYETNPYD
jgi:hypothetical protein